MTYIVHPPESALDVRYTYHWEILRAALEATAARWGPFRIVHAEFMTERRQAFELRNDTGKLNVMYLSTTPELEQGLVPVRIPVDKNLGGYCVLLIRKGDQPRMDAVRTITDLRRLKVGLGLGWVDVEILKADGFDVVTGSSYDGLFEMLLQRRFDVFPRAAPEVLDEYAQRQRAMPDLAIEKNLLLYYPLPMYFWFAKTDEGRRLAARAEEGMRAMIADGTFDEVFDRFQRYKIETLRLKERRVIAIGNPLLGPETPFADTRLWFDPKTYR
jgi:ABC-type amino acid transport substrate-binding protein